MFKLTFFRQHSRNQKLGKQVAILETSDLICYKVLSLFHE